MVIICKIALGIHLNYLGPNLGPSNWINLKNGDFGTKTHETSNVLADSKIPILVPPVASE